MTSAVAPDVRTRSLAEPRVLSRKRSIAVWSLIVVASILLVVTVLGLWVNRQVLDNKAWNKATTQVIRDPEITSALSTYLVNQLYASVDVAAELKQALPPNLQPLAPQIAASLQRPAQGAANALLQRPRVQQLFVNASTIAHQKLINVLENKTGYGVTTGNGVVTLNVKALLEQLAQQLGLSGKRIAQIPDDKAQIVLLRSDQLGAAQTGVRTLKVLSGGLLALVLVLYALAVYLARGARRVVLRRTGWALILVGALLLIVRKRAGDYAIDQLVSPTYKGSIHHLWLIGTSILGQIGYATVAYGVLLVLAAVLAGPSRAAVAARRAFAPVLNNEPWLVAASAAIVYLLIIFWGPTHALRMWWGMLLFAALIAGGLYVLRRQTLAEFSTA
jgi:hypothetical protein